MNNKYLELVKSKEWIEFYNYCNIGIFKQIDFFRYEDVHTNYLASLFKKDNDFQLDTKPLELLIELLKTKEDEKTRVKLSNIDFSKDIITKANTDTQIPIEKGRLDLLIDFSISNKKYNIILENKLLSSEGEKQTKKYQEYFEGEHNDIVYIYVFLSLEEKPILSSDGSDFGDYIKISYQDLIDDVLEKLDKNNKAPISIDEYLKGFTYLCKFDLMPINTKLESLVKNIYNNYSDTLYELINPYKNDELENKEELKILYSLLRNSDKIIRKQLFNKVGEFNRIKKTYGIRQQTEMVLDIIEDIYKNNYDLSKVINYVYNSGWDALVTEDIYYKLGSRQNNYRKLDGFKYKDKDLYYSCPVSSDELKGFVDFVIEEYEYSGEEIEVY